MRQRRGVSGAALAGLIGVLFSIATATAQAQAWAAVEPQRGGTDEIAALDTVTVVPGERYRAGWIRRSLFGAHYRALWTTPIRVPVLDLEHTAGGLTAERRGGGQQTRSLRLQAPDGRTFAFRSLDKDPSAILPPELRGTAVQEIVQDEISAAHPAGPLVAAAVQQFAGVPGTTPILVKLPASPRLGEFGAEFAGMVGYLQLLPEKAIPYDGYHFAQVINTERLMARLRDHPGEAVDASRFLRARLVDFFLGDWDRHRGQWHWAEESKGSAWEPVPSDRDQALVRFDGPLLAAARQTSAPQLVNFGDDIPVGGLTWNGRDLDRLILPRLDPAAWDSITADLVSRLDDAALDSIARAVPAVYGKAERQWLRAILARRRAALPAASHRFRRQVEATPDLLLTDAAERIELTSDTAGILRVVVHAAGTDASTLDRTFSSVETSELRIYALGGDDTVRATGASGRIGVRFVGGEGADREEPGSAPWLSYIEGGATWREIPDEGTAPPPRDYGSWFQHLPTIAFATDQGLLVGYWVRNTSYGFRRFPHASSWWIRGLASTSTGRPGLEVEGDIQPRDPAWSFGLSARATGVDLMRWYGLGNETVEGADRDRYRVDQWHFLLEPTINLHLATGLTLGSGPTLRFARTTADSGGLLTVDNPYGSGDFGQLGVVGYLRWQSNMLSSRSRIAAEVGGRVMPAVWDVASTYGAVHAVVTGRMAAGGALQPALTLRVQAEKLFGTAPFLDLATIGGPSTLRGYSDQRFRGDASLSGRSEARIRLARTSVILPADVGILGIADGGRVFLDGQNSDQWHWAAGGGIWLSWLGNLGSLTISAVASHERTMFYFGSALSY